MSSSTSSGKGPSERRGYQPQVRSNRSPFVLGALVVVVIAAVVIAVVWWTRSNEPKGADEAALDQYSIHVGAATAPRTVDIFEDFMCPHCGEFEKSFANEIGAAIDSGSLRVRYHLLTFLDGQSSTNYSSRAARAAYCVAEVNPTAFRTFHGLLFTNQPKEGSAGLSDAELTNYATQAGGTEDTARCISDGRETATVKTNADKSTGLLRDAAGQAATPSVVYLGKKVEIEDGWLAKIAGSPASS